MTTPAAVADPNSVAPNPTGQMTPEQQQRVTAAMRAEAARGLSSVGGVSVFLGIFWLLSYRGLDSPILGAVVFGVPLLALLVVFGVLYLRRAALLAEVQAGVVEYATGQVQYVGRSYAATVPGRSLNLAAISLAAGDYDFSFLPRSGWVVAATLAASDSPTRDLDELRHALAVSNHFSVDDLPLLRQGRLPPSAVQRLRREWSAGVWMIVAAAVCVVVFVVEAIAGQDANGLLLAFSCLGAILLGMFGLGTIATLSGRTQDVFAGKVVAVEGTLQKTSREVSAGKGHTTVYYYLLGSQEWRVTLDGYRALIEGRQYRIYSLPRNQALVGIEPFTDDLAPAASAPAAPAPEVENVTPLATAADEAAAAANRSGRLTDAQRQRVTTTLNVETGPLLIFFGFFALAAGLIFLASFGSEPTPLLLGVRTVCAVGIIVCLLAMAAVWGRRVRAGREVREGRVEQASGRVIWQSSGHQAVVPGHRLNLGAFNLKAGTYTFSFLPRSGRVVAAELVELDPSPAAHDDLSQALAEANHFSLEDLSAYRQGVLPDPNGRLRRIWTPTALMVLGSVLSIAAIGCIATVAADSPPGAYACFVAAFIVLGLGTLFSALRNISATRDVRDGKVASAQGLVRPVQYTDSGYRGSRYTTYSYRIDNHIWYVSVRAYRALIEGRTYRVYFLPRSDRLLAIEPIGQEQAPGASAVDETHPDSPGQP